MRKVLVIAAREYRAAVRTKAFLISLIVVPVLMGGSVVVQILLRNSDQAKEKRFAVIDRTPGEAVLKALNDAAKAHNDLASRQNAEGGKSAHGTFEFVRIEPGPDSPDAAVQQRLELSQLVENGTYLGFFDIGADVLSDTPLSPEGSPPDRRLVRFQSNKPQAVAEFLPWADNVLRRAVQEHRLIALRLAPDQAQAALQPVPVKSTGLSHMNPRTGQVEETTEERQIIGLVAPAVLIALMFMMIMIGASPAMQSVLEEKMQRIAEVLLGSVRPFDLMLGKLIGMVGVSLTVAVVYLGGGFIAAQQYGFTDVLSPYVLAWFILFLILAVIMYGSVFIAVGAAANDMKETQALLMPVMIVAVLPMILLGPVMTDPTSTFAVICSFIPTMTPMLMLVRISAPPGVAWWQPVVGILGVLATTLGCVYAAGRIFRVGILMQGKGARLTDLARWVVRG